MTYLNTDEVLSTLQTEDHQPQMERFQRFEIAMQRQNPSKQCDMEMLAYAV